MLLTKGINNGNGIEDGSFDELFNQYHGDIISTLDIENSLQFELSNPLLPENTPIAEASYWYKPLAN